MDLEMTLEWNATYVKSNLKCKILFIHAEAVIKSRNFYRDCLFNCFRYFLIIMPLNSPDFTKLVKLCK